MEPPIAPLGTEPPGKIAHESGAMTTFRRLCQHWLALGVDQNSIARRIGRGIQVIAGFAVVQAVAQGLGFVAGLILVRVLDKHDYALYALTITGINTLAMLSEGGTVEAATAIGGRNWQQAGHLRKVVASASLTQRQLAAITFPAVAIAIGWLLVRNGGAASEVLMLSGAACIIAYLQVSTSILSVVLRLRREVPSLQRLDLAGALLRMSLVIGLFFILNAETAILILAVSAGGVFALARRWTMPIIGGPTGPEVEIVKQVRSVVRRQWVNGLAFIFQGQITVLLLGLFGGSETVADFSALGRIAAAFAILGAVMQSIVLPRYARAQNPHEMLTLYVVILVGFIAVSAVPVLAAMLFPGPLLWILGAKYENLSHELVLVTLSAGAGATAFTAWGLNSVRAWIIPPWLNVPFIFGGQILLIAIIGVSTTDEMLMVGIVWNALSVMTSVIATIIFSKGFRRV